MLITTLSATAQDDSHTVPNELTGKWCYYNLANGDEGHMSNTCVTLNSDGSYELYVDGATMMRINSAFPNLGSSDTDYGSWWVQGNRIFFDSSSHGKGSLSLQKLNQPTDKTVPMLVLNGVAFVTASPRDPW